MVYGQELSNLNKVLITPAESLIEVPDLVLPSSVLVYSKADTLSPNMYTILSKGIKLKEPFGHDTLWLEYRAFPSLFSDRTSLLDSSMSKEGSKVVDIAFDYTQEAPEYSLFNSKGIDYDGSFGRSVSVGNAQSLVLNSNFNMQLNGNLGDDIDIVAAISDNSLPIQPEGNTQQLQEFDKVFIQLKKSQHTLTAGDFEVRKPKGYFLNYFKKLSGIKYGFTDALDNDWQVSGQASAAISRGKFARNIMVTNEGNQGPYNLIGNEGERFVIVLAGTERVFLDGLLLKRGANQDYVIDYNLGQITFMPKILVTKDSRFIIEFEYVDQQYGRSFFASKAAISNDKSDFYINVYHQQDSKSTNGEFALDSMDMELLNDAGDMVGSQLRSGIRPAESDELEDRIVYSQIDTFYFVDNQRFDTTILVYNPIPSESNSFIARFTEVGQNQGDYRLLPSGNNGRIYEWISPDPQSGNLRGNYVPKIALEAPASQQVVTVGGRSKVSKQLEITSEMAVSKLDKNRFSSLDDDDNLGMAGFVETKYSIPVGSKSWNFISGVRIEMNDEKFKGIAPFRNAEFQRDWNLRNVVSSTEQIGRADVGFSREDGERFVYSVTGYNQRHIFQGVRHSADLNFSQNGWKFEGRPSWLLGALGEETSQFIRPEFSIKKSFKNIGDARAGLTYLAEHNLQKDSSQNLTSNSYSFDQFGLQLKAPQINNWQNDLDLTYRIDRQGENAAIEEVSKAVNWGFNSVYQDEKGFLISMNLKYRDLYVERPDLINQGSQKTLLGRIENRFEALRGLLSNHMVYEITSGQEPRLEFAFEERRPGEGNYIYQDLNDDGIKQVNEYIPAPFTDTARYVRIQLYNSNFIKTNNLNFSQNIKLRPAAIWNDEAPIWAKRLLWTTLFKSAHKIDQSEALLNPYLFFSNDSNTVTFNALLQNNLFINQGDPKFDIQLGHRYLTNKVAATSGIETRKQSEYFGRWRYNIYATHDLLLNASIGGQESDSEFFSERDFNLTSFEIKPEWNAVFKSIFRVKANYTYTQKSNSEAFGGEEVTQHEFAGEASYRRSQKDALRLKLIFVSVRFLDKGNESLNYTILQGLRSGSNYQWQISYDRIVFKNIQLNLGYDGRKNGTGRIVHSGRVSLKAIF